MRFDVENNLLSKLIETKDYTLVKEQQIKDTFFAGENKKVFKFITEYVIKYGETPTPTVLEREFPSFKLSEVNEPLKYYCDELRKKVRHNKIAELTERLADSLDDLDSEKAFADLMKTSLEIQNEIVISTAVDITEDTSDRKESYKKRKETRGMLGISTGISHLDYIIKGLQKEQLITMIASTSTGKAVPLDTPVLTPDGFIPMRDIKVGNKVIDEKGEECSVIAIFPQGKKEVYKVTFSDGTISECCKDHLWKFKTQDDVMRKNNWRVKSLEELMKYPLNRGKGFNLCIPINKPITFSSKGKLPFHPYVLGVLLGDGGFTTDRISLSNPEQDIINKCNLLLKDWGEFVHNQATNCQYLFKSNNHRINKLFRSIDSLGLRYKKSRDKFIPTKYLFASIEERRQLLSGLFDTDGSISKDGLFTFSTFSIQLAKDVTFLCRSLGYRCTTSFYGNEIVIRIATKDRIFSSYKHQERFDNRIQYKKPHNYEVLKIINIEKVEEKECQCIAVDSAEHTFIINDFIVTHNTWFEVILGANAILNNCKVLHLVTEMSIPAILDRYDAILTSQTVAPINYNRFKSGTLKPQEEESYFRYLDTVAPDLESVIIEDCSGGVSFVGAKIDQYKPDLVLIDGAYLMEDERNAKEDWLRIAHITRDLHNLAKLKKVPIFINTQADNQTSKKTGPELGNIAYSRAVGQDSDVVLAIFQDEQMRNDKEMLLKVLKQREGVLGKVTMSWDFNIMEFDSIYASHSEVDDDKDVKAQTIIEMED